MKNPLYHELDRLNAELEKSRTMQAILFILWAQANELLNQPEIELIEHKIDPDKEIQALDVAASCGLISHRSATERKIEIISGKTGS
jgi:hypothetical protein